MRTEDAIAHYRTVKALSDALGIWPTKPYDWGEYPPPLQQLRLEKLTSGALRAEAWAWRNATRQTRETRGADDE